MSQGGQEFVRQVLFLASIVAGFSIAVAAQFISMKRKEKVVSAAIGAFLVSAALQVAVCFGFAFLLGISSNPPGMAVPSETVLTEAGATVSIVFYLGMVVFLAGLALTGWVYSRRMGVVSTVTAVLALAVMVVFFVWMLSLTGG